MQEKSTKPFQQKLDTLTELPEGFSFDAAQSWNKMEEKLTGKPSKNKRAVWHMVAASVLVVLLSAIYFFNQKKEDAITVLPAIPKIANPAATSDKTNRQVLVPVQEKETTGNTQQLNKKLKTEKPDVIVGPVEKEELRQEDIVLEIPKNEEVNVETNIKESTAVEIPVVVTPIKRKIIHINELGKERFLKEQQSLSVKEEKVAPDISTEEVQTTPKPWYKKFKSTARINNN